MTAISVTDFEGYVTQWAKSRNAQFKNNWTVKGGWEAWIQVDLVGYILSQDSTAEILREQSIYTSSGKRVDLLLNTDQDVDEQIPVEIKAQSFENRNNFLKEVDKDMDKISDELSGMYEDCTCIMLAIPFEQSALDSLMNMENDNDKKIFKRIFIGEVACCVAVYQDGWEDQ